VYPCILYYFKVNLWAIRVSPLFWVRATLAITNAEHNYHRQQWGAMAVTSLRLGNRG